MFIALAMLLAAQYPTNLLSSDHILMTGSMPQTDDHRRISAYPRLWQPSATEAAKAKYALYRFLNSNNLPHLKLSSGPITKTVILEDYAIQYVGSYMNVETGSFVLDGVKVIIIHAARKTSLDQDEDLEHSELRVMDGGDSYFDAYYDAQDDKMIMFSFHGYA